MPELVVDDLQGLNETPETSPEGLVQPNEAVVAENVDPFRGAVGAVVPTMKFDKLNLQWPTWDREHIVRATIRFAGKVLISVQEKDETGNLTNKMRLHYVNEDGYPEVPLNTEIGYEYDMIPKRWVVDPHVYEWKSDAFGNVKYYNLYLYGWRPEASGGDRYWPMRIVYSIDADGNETWVYIPMNIKQMAITNSLFLDLVPSVVGQGDFNGYYLYFFIIRDIAGNLFIHSDGWANPYKRVNCENKAWKSVVVRFNTGAPNRQTMKALGLSSIDIYRREVGETTTWVHTTRYVGTVDEYSHYITTFEDTKADDADLADLPEYHISEFPALCYNIDKAQDGVVGLWQNRLVFSVKNEIMWSSTALHTAYGNRFLNFPSANHHSFSNMGTITDLLEQRDNLVALSTSGISILYGSTLADMYSEKVDDASSVFYPNLHNDTGQWWWTAVNFDDWILFIDSAGKPRIFDGRDARPLGDKVIIPMGEQVEGKLVSYNVDAVRYRNGYVITTGDKIYVWCRDGNRWATWRGNYARFLRPNEPWLNEEYVSGGIPRGYEGRGGLIEPDTYYDQFSSLRRREDPVVFQTGNRTYLYLFDRRGSLYSYGAREDEYPVDMVWQIPKIPFKGENYFNLLRLHWSYLRNAGYEKQTAQPPKETPIIQIWFYGDDQNDVMAGNYIQFVSFSLPEHTKPGSYKEMIPISIRANKLGFYFLLTHGRFFQLDGYELVYQPRGGRTYGR